MIDKEKLQEFISKIEPFVKRYRYPILVLFAGFLLLALGTPWGQTSKNQSDDIGSTAEANTAQDTGQFDLAAFEAKLSEDIGQISGVGRISLSLSLKSTEEAVYAADIRESNQSVEASSYESTVSIISDGDYGQQPILVKKQYPAFRGALVLCDGADQNTVRLAVTEAVSTMCGIGADKVAVLKMQS